MIEAVAEPCPDENALSELVQGLLDAATASALEVHLDGCAGCRRIVSSVGQSSYLAGRIPTRVDDAPEVIVAGGPSTWSMAGAAPVPTLSGPAPIPPPMPPHDAPPVGAVLAGKYRVERLLGQGGMGVVIAATHLSLGKLVAIKLMRRDLAVDPAATQRFVREARAASRLRSEHIVRVIDLDTLDSGAPYIAMEYLAGEDLGALLARGPVSPGEAAIFIGQVCEAVGEAHAAGIVHRDLKPANLFVTRRDDGSPCMKVLDFGVSKIIAGPLADDLKSTDTRALVGSPYYMAPEQLISAKAVDPRTDVWALGCILYELVSGRHPFVGAAIAQVLASILRDEPPPLASVCPQVPVGFAAVVARCLAKDPAQRYATVGELGAALAPFVVLDRPSTLPEPRLVAAPLAVAAALPAPTTIKVGRRARWPFAVLAAVGVVVIAIAIALAAKGDQRATSAPEPPNAPPPAPAANSVEPTVTPIPQPEERPATAAPTAKAATPATRPDEPRPKKKVKKPRKLEDDLLDPTFKR